MDYEMAKKLYPLLSMPDGGGLAFYTDDGFCEDGINDNGAAVACQSKLISALYNKAGIVSEEELLKRYYLPESGMNDTSMAGTIFTHHTDASLTYMFHVSAEELFRTEHYTWELYEMCCATIVLTCFIDSWEEDIDEEELKLMAFHASMILQSEVDDDFIERVCMIVRYLILLRKYGMHIPEEIRSAYTKPGSFGFRLSYASYADTILNVIRKDMQISSDECFAWFLPEALSFAMIPGGLDIQSSKGYYEDCSELAVFFSRSMGDFLSTDELSIAPEYASIMHAAVTYIRSVFDIEEEYFEAATFDHFSKDGFCFCMQSMTATQVCHMRPLYGMAVAVFDAAYNEWKRNS